MKILIVDCLSMGDGRRKFSRDFIGGGPKLIAGVINQLNLPDLFIKIKRAEVLFFNGVKNEECLKNYDLCLISAMTMDIKSVKIIISKWRNVNHTKMIIVGGPIASDDKLLKKIDADIIIQGEGEKTIKTLIKIIFKRKYQFNELINVNGILFRHSGKIIKTKPSTALSIDDYNKFSDSLFYLRYIKNYTNYRSARIYVECLRGCSNFYRNKFELKKSNSCLNECKMCIDSDLKNRINCPSNIPPGCGFCSTISTFGYPKSRDQNYIIKEIFGLIEIGAKRIVLGGPDFLDYKREILTKDLILTTPDFPPEPNYNVLNKLINAILQHKDIKEGNVQIFIENIKANLCTLEALKIIARIPNSIFSIGCETGSIEFSEKLGRPFIPIKTLDVIKNAFKLGIRVHVYFIHSLPGETIEYLKESIDLIQDFYKFGVEKITIYKYQEFPGAPFYLLKNKSKMMQISNKKLNSYRKKLVRTAINFNKQRKEEMVEKSFKVILAERYLFNDSHVIGYIIQGGPKVLIKNAINNLGEELFVKIIHVLSDKLVEGEILHY